jgi:hypothetical protein
LFATIDLSRDYAATGICSPARLRAARTSPCIGDDNMLFACRPPLWITFEVQALHKVVEERKPTGSDYNLVDQ